MKTFTDRVICLLLTAVLTVQIFLFCGVSAFAAAPETPIVPIGEQKVEITGLHLRLDGEIGLVYHIKVPSSYRTGYLTLSCRGETVVTQKITECQRDETNRFLASCSLSAIELSEPVTVTVYDKNDVVLASMSRSAEEYANLLLESETATEQEKNVAVALINYGHYAQLACAEANGWTVNQKYAETAAFSTPAVGNDVFDPYTVEWSDAKAAEQFSMSLNLDYKTDILMMFPSEEPPTVTVNGEEIEAEPVFGKEKTYLISIRGINALCLEKNYTVAINDVTVKLCAFSYCKLAVQHRMSRNTLDAMRALYEFYSAVNTLQSLK